MLYNTNVPHIHYVSITVIIWTLASGMYIRQTMSACIITNVCHLVIGYKTHIGNKQYCQTFNPQSQLQHNHEGNKCKYEIKMQQIYGLWDCGLLKTERDYLDT